jgi:hypothetical protein
MEWDLHGTDGVPPPPQGVAGSYRVKVVGMFGEYPFSPFATAGPTITFPGSRIELLDVLGTDSFIGCTLIRHGAIPSAPGNATVAIATQALELYRLAHFRCPQLSISAFAKTISDLHSVGL